MVLGLILIAIGVISLLIKLGVIAGSVWSYTWPVILIILGLSWFLGHWRWKRWGWRHQAWWWCRPWRYYDEEKPPKRDE